ncbi:sensor histidine kinase [Flavihumibacter profundi]|uniref:sensor histidine kinase n=1 Tax=Flavihumibacter profundi TaxID=2716883 RepID=UPI001CC7E530|nr:7TM diverse intracellular signaling domain-containing protein [Flavihumibacter profundi]MBZ5857168.1 histidine kinase [Flavihumibacter profundi]
MPISLQFRLKNQYFFLVFFLFLCSNRLFAQSQSFQLDTIKLSNIRLSQNISGQTALYIDSSDNIQTEHLHQLPSLQRIPVSMGRKLPVRFVGKNSYLQFNIWNDADSAAHIFFLPGFYCNTITLFKYNAATQQFDALPRLPGNKQSRQDIVRRLDLAAGERATFIAELGFFKTTVNAITPTLCYDFFLPSLLNQLQNERKLNSIITYMVCGIMLMMVFYSLAGYYTSRRMEFIYYGCYTFLLGLMFFYKAYFYKIPTEANFFFESYFDFIMQGTGTIFYFIFLRNFINTKNEYPLLNKVLYAQQVITVLGLVLFTYLNFFTNNFFLQNLVENGVKYSWSVSIVLFIGFAIFRQSSILLYLAIGHSCLLLGGFLSLYMINTSFRFNSTLTSLANDSLFWYEMGILLELVFFMVALSFKNKQEIAARAREKERILMEYEKSAIERKVAILAAQQEERNRISADMHDELGSGVTAIRLLSELAKAKMKDNTLPEIEKISNSANDLITKMNTIIWTMKSSNDTVDNTIAYVRAYASEFLDNTDITCKVEYPEVIPIIELTGERRRNIFLCIKEALNNIVKHAAASAVTIRFQIGPQLVITISDNGTGLIPEKLRYFGNGITNMHKRMESIDGHFNIRNDKGTTIMLSVPLG